MFYDIFLRHNMNGQIIFPHYPHFSQNPPFRGPRKIAILFPKTLCYTGIATDFSVSNRKRKVFFHECDYASGRPDSGCFAGSGRLCWFLYAPGERGVCKNISVASASGSQPQYAAHLIFPGWRSLLYGERRAAGAAILGKNRSAFSHFRRESSVRH